MFKSFVRILSIAVIALTLSAAQLGTAQRATAQNATQVATMQACSATCAFPRTVTDGAGNSVTIKALPMHIASATLATDEMLTALVDPSRVAAITINALDATQSNIADIAKTIPNKLGTPLSPEAVIALKPDLVFVASYTDAGVVKQLKDAGLTVFQFANFNSIKDIENNVMLVGKATGSEDAAAQLVNGMETKLKAIADAVKNVKPLTVLYYGPDGYSNGVGSTIDEVLTRAGGKNAVTVGGIKDNPYPQLSDEFLVTQDPDVILLAGFNSYAPGFVDKFNKNPNFQTLKAIKNKRVVIANDAHIASISQYIVLGVSDVAALLYPDAYKPDATPNTTMSATAVATMNATVNATMIATVVVK